MEKNYTVTLADGTQLTELALNGNNFISSKKVEASTFEGKLSTVTINDGENDEVLHNAELVQCVKIGREYWFILREVPESEARAAAIDDSITAIEEALAEVYELIVS